MVCAEKPCIFLSFLWINEPFLFLGTNCLLITLLQSAKIFISKSIVIHRNIHIIHKQRQVSHKSLYHVSSLNRRSLAVFLSYAISAILLSYTFLFFRLLYPQYVNKDVDKIYTCV